MELIIPGVVRPGPKTEMQTKCIHDSVVVASLALHILKDIGYSNIWTNQ